MNSIRIKDLSFAGDLLTVTFDDEQKVTMPLAFFPRLRSGAPEERADWELIGRGLGVHWKRLDEDLSVENILTAYSRHRRSAYSGAGGAPAR